MWIIPQVSVSGANYSYQPKVAVDAPENVANDLIKHNMAVATTDPNGTVPTAQTAQLSADGETATDVNPAGETATDEVTGSETATDNSADAESTTDAADVAPAAEQSDAADVNPVDEESNTEQSNDPNPAAEKSADTVADAKPAKPTKK
ncbi:hypothetical protein BN8_03653 [Fibrisoma limi BUZ 3]|uniref:Uncharacterized protein n=1 Tax=Fibrisoma limi BUZ 3 TaxID=1185876 RepID=I2GKQ3_9BACT|nr:hypothetical protein [Fibrisoma limi]CCH54479.1 hypothetical protein BN8_03653 [Fibrisoma limi BUZ 3]